jgi:hypothetical protein
VILEAQVDDDARTDGDRRDQEDHRPPARRPAAPAAAPSREPQTGVGRQHHERRHAEEVAAEPVERVVTDEAAPIVEEMRNPEVEVRPEGEDGEGQRRQRDIDEESSHRTVRSPDRGVWTSENGSLRDADAG